MGYQVSGVYPRFSGRQTHYRGFHPLLGRGGNADTICQPDSISIQHFWVNVKFNFSINPLVSVYIPQAKAWGFDGGVLKTAIALLNLFQKSRPTHAEQVRRFAVVTRKFIQHQFNENFI